MNNYSFEEARNKVMGPERQRQGIGTLQEKTLHAVLKHYYAPDEDMHEIPIGHFVADIYNGKEIIEIQTSQFNRMRDKLTYFLDSYPVTIVHPIPYRKWLCWIDQETGECSKPRKSPVTGSIYRVFAELYKIKEYLPHRNLRLCFPFIDMEEYRLLNGWSNDKKKGSHRYDRIPLAMVDEVRFECPEDYLMLIPMELEEPFAPADLGRITGIRKQEAALVLHILLHLGIVERVGKRGRSYVYLVKERSGKA